MLMDRDVKSRIKAQIALTAKAKERELRDYFAGQALAGLCADPNQSGSFNDMARSSYEFADAMMKARATAPQQGEREL